MKTLRAALAASVLLSVVGANAQGRFAFANTFLPVDSTKEGIVQLHIVNENFFKNDEYFGDYAEGYTLLGYHLSPTVRFAPASNVTLEAGVEMLQYGGTTKLKSVTPIVTAQWRVNPSLTVVMGHLDGALHHQLSEAIYDAEYQLSATRETGVQILWCNARVDGQLWVNWQNFIERGDTVPERFMAGVVSEFSLLRPDVDWQLQLPVAVTVSHIGGQISNYPDTMQSLANAAAAVAARKRVEGSFVTSFGAEVQALCFYTMTGSGVRPFSQGGAFYPKANIATRLFDAQVGYFTAKNYFALHGNPLYMSLSNYKAHYRKQRNLVTAEANLNYQVARDVRFSLGAKCYYDVDAQQMEYNYGFYLVITPTIDLFSTKARR